MRSWQRPLSIRVRLTLWYTGAMVVVLAVYAAGVYTFVRTSVSQTLNEKLRSDFQWPAQMLERLPNGEIHPNDPQVEADSNGPWLHVWNPAGGLIYSTPRAHQYPIPRGTELAAQPNGSIVPVGGRPPVRVLTAKSNIGGQQVVVQVAADE